ncbi:uncharacterized protein LOC132174175 [Corylus avellana]|uniref:uncharacterized protein LOC132174175 n=1 Tax=Corylus avellana TaxID=13451 RepID=UPI00286B239C|nr:uncharacterized protein LOC132174175 [Corylus avellana]
MDQSFRDALLAAQQGSVDALYTLIHSDAKVLDRIDEIPFVDTPLHVAAYAGHTRFAMEIVRLKPSFIRKLNQNGFTPVHLALQNDQTQLLHRLLDVDDHLVRVQGREGVTLLHYAAQTGNIYLLAEFQKVCPMSIKDVTIRGETALHIALNYNQLEAFELLIRWLQQTTFEDSALWEKKLLNWKDEEGKTVLHIAAMKTLPQVVRWLLDARIDTNATNLAGFTALNILEGQTQIDNNEIRDMLASSLPRTFTSPGMDQSLRDVATQGNIDALYALVRRDVKVLDRIDKLPFVETPLHVAAFEGHTRFALEIMRLKQSFCKKLNEDGFTPMHLALQNNQTEVVRMLLEVDKDLVRVQGNDGMTPLHYIAQTGSLDLLPKFLNVCPKSIKDVTIQRDNAFHIVLKNDQVDAFDILMNWYESITDYDKFTLQDLLNSKDKEGNTLLHIAVSQNQPQLRYYRVHNPFRRHVLSLRSSLPNELRSMLLVVAVLFLTLNFQLVLTPPGGLWQDNCDPQHNSVGNCTVPHQAGKASRCEVAAVVVAVAVGGNGGVVGAATEKAGEEDGGDREESRENGEIRDDRFSHPFKPHGAKAAGLACCIVLHYDPFAGEDSQQPVRVKDGKHLNNGVSL